MPSPPWGVSEWLERALQREVVIPEKVVDERGDPALWRDTLTIKEELAMVIFYAHPPRTAVWENLSEDVKNWVRDQAEAVLQLLESKNLLHTELGRLR